MKCIYSCILFFFLLTFMTTAQETKSNLQKGFNLGGWFEKETATQIVNSHSIFTLENIKALGADHFRLPIDLFNFCGESPGFTIDPILFSNLDRVVDWAEETGLQIILDNHISAEIDTTDLDQLIAIWEQMAEHFKNRSELVYYEILNEPHNLNDTDWGKMQGEIIEVIRNTDTTHFIIVSATGYSNLNNLSNLPQYNFEKLIYTFHFYDPWLFTHQGTNWTSPSMEEHTGFPYPYNASEMPEMPNSFPGTWLESVYNNYENEATPETIELKIEAVVNFSENRQAPVYCGEFGVWQDADNDDRLQWYTDVLDLLNTNEIAWSSWGYAGKFGVFREETNNKFPQHLDTLIVEAIGLTVPEMTTEIPADTSNYIVYDDFSNREAADVNWSNSNVSYYVGNSVQGDYCIQWSNAAQYDAMGWEYITPKNFSFFYENNFILKFWLKSTSPDLKFDIRFMDMDLENGEDLPWRMTATIDSNLVTMDSEWHEVEIPLKEMTEPGTFYNNSWYSPEGKFDWANIDKLQFVAEHHHLNTMGMWIDDIRIVKNEINTAAEIKIKDSKETIKSFQAFPNPFSDKITIQFELSQNQTATIQVFDMAGNLIKTIKSGRFNTGKHQVLWNGKTINGKLLSNGFYTCVLQTENQILRKKVLLLK